MNLSEICTWHLKLRAGSRHNVNIRNTGQGKGQRRNIKGSVFYSKPGLRGLVMSPGGIQRQD